MFDDKTKELLSEKKQSENEMASLSIGEKVWKYIKKDHHYIIGIAVLIVLGVSIGGISKYADATKGNLENDFGIGTDTLTVSELNAEKSGTEEPEDTDSGAMKLSQIIIRSNDSETPVTEPLYDKETVSNETEAKEQEWETEEQKETEEYRSAQDRYNEYLAQTCDDISDEDALYHNPEFMEQKMRANDPDHYRFDRATGKFVPIDPDYEG